MRERVGTICVVCLLAVLAAGGCREEPPSVAGQGQAAPEIWQEIMRQVDTLAAECDAIIKKRSPEQAGTIDMPVLFEGTGADDEALASTTNHVNSLVDPGAGGGNGRVITGSSFGPRVDYMGSGTPSSILDDYVKRAFEDLAGYDEAVFTDARSYHNGAGSVHCATNSVRELPAAGWWGMP